MRSEVGVAVGLDPGEIAQRIQVGAALQVALAGGEHKAELISTRFARFDPLHGIQEPEKVAQRKRLGRRLPRQAELGLVFIYQPVLDARPARALHMKVLITADLHYRQARLTPL